MNRRLLFALIVLAGTLTASSQNLGDLLNGLRNNTETTDSTSSSDNGGLGALGAFLGNTLASKNFSLDDLNGNWNYTSPAVSFQSDNALKKIGGAGAATALENKLAPYYTRLRLDKTSLSVAEDHTFEMKLGVATLKGTVEKDKNDQLVFNFSAFGKIKLGKVNATATKAGNTLNLTFDATKMIQILTKVAGAFNMQSLNALTSLINSYDGVYLGFKLKKTAQK